jgi:hypothetical protein
MSAIVDAFWRKIPDSLKRRIYHPRAGDLIIARASDSADPRRRHKCAVLHASRKRVVVHSTALGKQTWSQPEYIRRLKSTLAHGAVLFPRGCRR